MDGITENVDSAAVIYVNRESGNYTLAADSPGKNGATDGTDVGYISNMEPILPSLASPGFEEDTAFLAWTQDWDNSSINEDADYVFSGSKSLKVGPPAGGRAQYLVTGDFTPGTTVSLLAWGKSDGTLNEHAYIGFEADDEFGINLMEVDSRVEIDGESVTTINPDGWTRLAASMTIPAQTVEILVYFWYSGDGANNVASVYIDDFEFKFGDSTATATKIKPVLYNSQVNVYPNPTSGSVQIALGKDINNVSGIEIFDITGKLISKMDKLNGQSTIRIDLSSAPAGMYFGKVISTDGIHSFKLLKR